MATQISKKTATPVKQVPFALTYVSNGLYRSDASYGPYEMARLENGKWQLRLKGKSVAEFRTNYEAIRAAKDALGIPYEMPAKSVAKAAQTPKVAAKVAKTSPAPKAKAKPAPAAEAQIDI